MPTAVVNCEFTSISDANSVSGGGVGVFSRLCFQAALDFVVEEDLKAHLTCWYIQKYVKENPLPQYVERLQS